MVRGRNEAVATAQIAWIVSRVKGVELEEVARQCEINSRSLLGIAELVTDWRVEGLLLGEEAGTNRVAS